MSARRKTRHLRTVEEIRERPWKEYPRGRPIKGIAVGSHKYLPAPKSGESGLYLYGSPNGGTIYVTPLLPGVGPDDIEPKFSRQRHHLCGWPGRPFWWARDVHLSDWAKR